METINITIFQDDVYDEVAKATDYTGSKLIDGDEGARDRILASDDDLAGLGRFWEETISACNESLKEMLVSGKTKLVDAYKIDDITFQPIYRPSVDVTPIAHDGNTATSALPPAAAYPVVRKTPYDAVIEVSKSFDKTLTGSVQSTLRSYFISSIIGQWFKFANKGEAKDYFMQAAELMEATERLLYSRRKPTRPTD